MLSKKQWQWFADHYAGVRVASAVIIIFGLLVYLSLIAKVAIWDLGKAPIPYKPESNYIERFGCRDKIEKFNMNSPGGNKPAKSGFYEEANIFKLEGYRTYMVDAKALTKFPECIGAFLADNANSPDHFVFILFDRNKQRPVYRLAHIDGVVRK